MMVCLRKHVFIRRARDESIVWCPRTGGCTVLKNAQPILEEIKREWRSTDEIVKAVLAKFECEQKEVTEGVKEVVAELVLDGKGVTRIL